jgi:hypothetical protein
MLQRINSTPRSLYPGERASVHIVVGAGWAPGPVGMGGMKENLLPAAEFEPRTVHTVASDCFILTLVLL